MWEFALKMLIFFEVVVHVIAGRIVGDAIDLVVVNRCNIAAKWVGMEVRLRQEFAVFLKWHLVANNTQNTQIRLQFSYGDLLSFV